MSQNAGTRIGGTRVLSLGEFADRRAKEVESRREDLERLEAEMRAATARYQASLRAVMPTAWAGPVVTAAAVPLTGAGAGAVSAEPELTDHNYDGIQEYDNPTPGWWHALFIGSIVFSVFYVMMYHMSPLFGSLPERHAAAVARADQKQFAELAVLPMGEEKILRIMGNPAWLDHGRGVFEASCAQCHRKDGGGMQGLGQNMTDEVFKYVTNLESIARIVHDGIPPLMPAKGGRRDMSENDIALVAAYVASLRGTNAPDGKAAEGEPIAPFPAPITADSGV